MVRCARPYLVDGEGGMDRNCIVQPPSPANSNGPGLLLSLVCPAMPFFKIRRRPSPAVAVAAPGVPEQPPQQTEEEEDEQQREQEPEEPKPRAVPVWTVVRTVRIRAAAWRCDRLPALRHSLCDAGVVGETCRPRHQHHQQ